MNNPEREELQDLLRKLLDSVYSICNEVIATKRLKPLSQLFYKYKLDDFKYDDSGTHIQGWKSEPVVKQDWYGVTTALEQVIKKLGLYDSVLDKIRAEPALRQLSSPDYYLSLLTRVIAKKIFAGEITDKSELEPHVVSSLRDLNGENQTYKLVAHIKGIVLKPKSIQLNGDTLLRQPTRTDIEIEYPADASLLVGHEGLEIPTAIMEITGVSPPYSLCLKASKEFRDTMTILSLFAVGGIEYFHWATSTDSLTAIGGPIRSEKFPLTKQGSYLVKKKDAKILQPFWSNMKKIKLPETYAASLKGPDELSIAYERYNDSLEGGIPEKRISSAVMGLETLYLSPSERQELTYKVSMRASKLLGQIGYSVEKVSKELTHAYDIRSTYVHGKVLTLKQKRRHEREVGDLNQFPQIVIDYLRASIVALLKRPKKDSLLKQIDDSLLDSKKEKEVKELLFMPYRKEVF